MKDKVLIYWYNTQQLETISILDYHQLIHDGEGSNFWVVPMLDPSYYNPLTQEVYNENR